MPWGIEICSRSQAMSDVETRIRSGVLKGPVRMLSDQTLADHKHAKSAIQVFLDIFASHPKQALCLHFFMKKDGRLLSVYSLAKPT